MSNQQLPHDEFGGFGESDDQTFLHDKSKLSSATPSTESPEATKEGKDASSGFISYVRPDLPPEEERSSLKKVALIAIATVSAFAIIWMLIPSTEQSQSGEGQIAVTDTIQEQADKQVQKQNQNSTMEQDSIARVQDYLARMQMSQGKNIGNNERNDDAPEDIAPAPDNKIVPPDPIPAKTYPEYRDVEDSKLSESVQNDKPVHQKPKVQKTVQQAPKKQTQNIAQKPMKSNAEKKSPDKMSSQKQSQQDQVLSETFIDKEPSKKPIEEKREVKNRNGEEYSVQVLSSISKDEADKTLKTLKSRGVSSASITKKTLNGKTWYRVRFGSFEDRKQAQNAAQKAGYSNSWVDRVK